jgi:hypothetical protein
MVPDPSEKAGVSEGVLVGAPYVQGLRCRPENGTCGWYFTAGDDNSEDDDFFKPLHVAHLQEYCPEVLPYLALPPGRRIIIGPGLEQVTFDPQLLKENDEDASLSRRPIRAAAGDGHHGGVR